MSVRSYSVIAVAALMSTVASVHAEDAPSNAELFRMLKEQQKTIADLRQELKQSRQDQRSASTTLHREVETAKTAAGETGRKAAMQAMAADTAGPMYTKAPGSLPTPNRFTLMGEYLALKAGVGDTGFVISSPVSTSFPNGNGVNNDPGYKSAFRVGAGYEFGDSNRAINLYYTHLRETESKTVNGPFLWATLGRADLTSGFENYTGSASSQIGISYDRVDLLFSEPLKWFDSRVAFLWGLEYAKINVDEAYAYASTGNLGTITNSSHISGIGPQIGLSIDHDLIRNSSAMPGVLSVNAVSTASLLFAKSNVTQIQASNGSQLLNVSDDSTNRVVPAIHMRGGLTYSFPVTNYSAAISVGYDFNSYIGAISRGLWPDDVADGLTTKKYENFDASGPYANVRVKF